MQHRISVRTLGLLVLALSIGIASIRAGDGPVASMARAIEADPELRELVKQYDSPLFIPAADFRTDGLYPEAQFYSTAGYWQGDDLGGVYLIAPVWLPHGTNIDSVWLFAVDDDGDCSSDDIAMWMHRVDNYTGQVDGMAAMSTSGAHGNMQTPYESDPAHPVIDYPGFAYWLTVRVCSTDHEVYGAMILY
jgi:hypothetical protein